MAPDDDITERKRAEEALQESDERFRSAFEHAAIGMALVDTDGRFLQVNRSLCEMLGRSQRELTSTTWQATTHRDDIDVGADHVKRLLFGESESCQFEKRYLHKAGHVIWALLSFSVVRDATGSPLYFISQIQDITERKRAEEALRESEELHRITLSSVSDAVFITDDAGVFIYVCPNVDAIFGYSFDEVVTFDNISRLLGDGLFDPDELKGRGEIPNIEREIRDKAGDGHALLVTVKCVSIKGGTVLYTCRDITERKRAEEALRESEERFRSTLDGMMEGCQINGFNWRYLYVNDAMAQHGRRAKEELLGRTMMEMYPGIEDTEVFAYLRRCMEERIPHRMETEYTYPGGDKSWFELGIQPVPEGIFILSLDITERKRAEEALQAAREELEGKVEHQLLRRNHYSLTFRELTVLHKVAAGRSDKEIGAELAISPLTAQKHISNILAKMDAASRTEAAARAIREGLLE